MTRVPYHYGVVKKYRTIFFILSLIALNLAMGAGVYYDALPEKIVLYTLWGQVALVGLASILAYAKHLIVFFVMLLLSWLIFSLTGDNIWHDPRIPLTFWGMYSLCWLFYFEFVKTRLGQWVRHLHPLQSLVFFLLYMGGSMFGCFALTAKVFNGWDLVSEIPGSVYALFIGMAALIPTMTIGALKIIDIIGASHVFYFLTGTYHRPTSKQRIVLFLDMVGSSAIAEKLEPKQSMGFIARFIYDSSMAFRLKGGDIVNYTGDGLVVLWPMDKAVQAVESVETLKSIIKKNTALYKQKFGLVPSFRVGIHGGEVIISQIGEEKLFLGLYGDVVNTAARLEQMCKEIGTDLLFSKTVRQYMDLEMKNKTKPLGRKAVRGRDEKIDIFTLEGNKP